MERHVDMTRTVAPAVPLLTAAEARTHLRVDDPLDAAETAQSALIESLVKAATSEIDGWDGWLGRALVTQTWQMRLAAWPSRGFIRLPLPPFQAVTDFRVIEPDGSELELVEDTDFIVEGGDPARLVAKTGIAWPSIAAQGLPIRVTFRCGYGNAASDVPEAIRHYVRVRVGQLFEHREMVVVGTSAAEIPFLRHMIDSWRHRAVVG